MEAESSPNISRRDEQFLSWEKPHCGLMLSLLALGKSSQALLNHAAH